MMEHDVQQSAWELCMHDNDKIVQTHMHAIWNDENPTTLQSQTTNDKQTDNNCILRTSNG